MRQTNTSLTYCRGGYWDNTSSERCQQNGENVETKENTVFMWCRKFPRIWQNPCISSPRIHLENSLIIAIGTTENGILCINLASLIASLCAWNILTLFMLDCQYFTYPPWSAVSIHISLCDQVIALTGLSWACKFRNKTSSKLVQILSDPNKHQSFNKFLLEQMKQKNESSKDPVRFNKFLLGEKNIPLYCIQLPSK